MIELDKKEIATEDNSNTVAEKPTSDTDIKRPNKLVVYGIVIGIIVVIGIILCVSLSVMDKNDIGPHNTASSTTHSVTVSTQVEEDNSLPNEENSIIQPQSKSKGLGEFTWVAMLGGGIIVMMLLMEAVKGGIQIATGESRSFAPVIAPILAVVVVLALLFVFIHMT